ncbi:MAG: MmgE/PrpD family protein [Actinomycetota bacterium]|nr:MmgE/PrpD family protein [Actinomycetota bacterium]
MSAIRSLAKWAAEVPDDHGEEAYARARAGLIDTVACLVAGAYDPATAAVREAISGWGEGVATVVGTPKGRPAPWAALANGTAANALDFDDYDIPAVSHPSAAIVPAVMAIGEENGVTGRSLLDAYIVGIEVQMRVGEALNMSHFDKGFHSTATIGTLAATVASARLLGLDAVATGNALAIATSLAAGFKSQLGTTTIHLHTGLAAHNGVLAAGLGAAGATGSSEALDGEWGTLRLMANSDAPGFAGPLAKLGNPLAIEEFGLCVKPYPCCSYAAASIDALLSLRAEHELRPEDIVRITATIPAQNIELLKFPEPTDELEARFSMEYCLAVASLHGAVVVGDFDPVAVSREPVRNFLPRVSMEALPEGPEPRSAGFQPETVKVELTDGRTLARTINEVRGSPALPLTETELLEKFDSCAACVPEQNDRNLLKQALLDIGALGDVRELTAHLPTRP